MIESYINSVVEFTWNSKKHMGVIADVSSDNRVVCYRVINSTDAKKLDKNYIALYDSTGRKTDFLIDYKSRFYLPQNRFDRVMIKCSADSVATASVEYSELPPLSELEEDYNKLYAQIKGLPPKDSKEFPPARSTPSAVACWWPKSMLVSVIFFPSGIKGETRIENTENTVWFLIKTELQLSIRVVNAAVNNFER